MSRSSSTGISNRPKTRATSTSRTIAYSIHYITATFMLPDALCNSLSLSRSLARSLIYPCVFAFRSCHHVPIPTAVLLASRLAYLFFLFPKRVNEPASGWVRGPFVHPLAAVHSLSLSLSLLLISHTLFQAPCRGFHDTWSKRQPLSCWRR